jgi:alpha-1,6-mannosyltransferase
MRSWLRVNAPACIGAGVGIATVSWLALSSWAWTDYDAEARPAFDALVNGHVSKFFLLAPAYGGSMLLRAPFVLVPKLWGGGELSMFRAAAAPCLAASAILGIWLVARMRALGRTTIARAVALFLCVANPLTLAALQYGHPEELLGAVLCIAAVLVAMRGRPLWAGVLLGLAIANKEWAIVAVGPVLVALPGGRIKAMITTGGVAAAVLAPFVLFGSSAGSAVSVAGSHTGQLFNPWQFWWFLGSHAHPVRDVAGHVKAGYRVPPGWVSEFARQLIVGITAAVVLLYAWARRGRRRVAPNDALLLLALVLLLRCALDPWDFTYYSIPFLITLVVWEALTFDRPPVLALTASFLAWFTLQEAPVERISPDLQALIFLALAGGAAVAMVAALFAPGWTERLAVRARRRDVVPSPA